MLFPVSIHAPARGATIGQNAFSGLADGFNSRARKGRDSWQPLCQHYSNGFNSRARKGRDKERIFWHENVLKFQFTRPQGARQG